MAPWSWPHAWDSQKLISSSCQSLYLDAFLINFIISKQFLTIPFIKTNEKKTIFAALILKSKFLKGLLLKYESSK